MADAGGPQPYSAVWRARTPWKGDARRYWPKPAPQQRPTSVDDEATAQQAQTASNEPSQPVQPPVVVRAPRPDVPVPPRQVETGREDDLDVPDFLK